MADILDKMKVVFQGQPVPYVRTTQTMKYMPKAQNYLGYRSLLATYIRNLYPEWIIPERPEDKKLSKLWLEEQKRYQYRLGVNAYTMRDNMDWDNCYKCVADCLQQAQVMWNDKMIRKILPSKIELDKANPRLEITLIKELVPLPLSLPRGSRMVLP